MLKAVIPVNGTSSRVPNKNFRPFWGELSLFDLTVRRLLRCLSPEDIFVSCDDPARRACAERYGVNFIVRDARLTLNETPLPDVIRGVTSELPSNSDVMWCQVIQPFFDEYTECIEAWARARKQHDSLTVVHPRQGYYLDHAFMPDGFGFGPWHIPSQRLPQRYQLTFVLSILSAASLEATGYQVGASPYWYVARDRPIDIDTLDDFQVAQAVYAHRVEQGLIAVADMDAGGCAA